MQTIERYESVVRSYCRSFPTVFTKARGATLVDEGGREYIDFFAGAGALNYGHNPPEMKEVLLEYIQSDGVVHSLDMATSAKVAFLQRFHDVILAPRGLDYKLQFPGPTGTNAVEAALKLARKVTGRQTVVSFTNAFHGMTLGSLSMTGNSFKRQGAGVPLNHSAVMPYDGYMGQGRDSLEYFEMMLVDNGSGVDLPAAAIVETVQGEGGINVASRGWLRRLAALCKKHDILLIVDDIQAGCGRTGTFFSFEFADITPDIICLSKSLSGYGTPFALTLIRPELDVWAPGEHNGTFRGHNLAFVTATKALDYWADDALTRAISEKETLVRERLEHLAARYPGLSLSVRGRGLMYGLSSEIEGLANEISAKCFERGVIAETAGPDDTVFKIFPPLTIETALLEKGMDVVAEAVAAVAAERGAQSGARKVA